MTVVPMVMMALVMLLVMIEIADQILEQAFELPNLTRRKVVFDANLEEIDDLGHEPFQAVGDLALRPRARREREESDRHEHGTTECGQSLLPAHDILLSSSTAS